MRRAGATIGALLLGFVLAGVSLPWLMWALGRALCGDDNGADAAIVRSPIYRWFDWIEARA